MNSTSMTISIALMSILSIWRFRYGNGSTRTSVHMMVYMTAATFVFNLYIVGVFSNGESSCYYGSETMIPGRAHLFFIVLFSIFTLSDLLSWTGGQEQGQFNKEVSIAAVKISGSIKYINYLIIIYCIMFTATRNFNIIFENQDYLLMVSPQGGGEDPISVFLSSILTPVYFSGCIILAIELTYGRRFLHTVLIGICVVWLSIIEISAASRVGGIGFLLFCVVKASISRANSFAVIASGFLGIYLVQAALIGRGLGNFGLGNFVYQFSLPFHAESRLLELIQNLFQGVITTADGLLLDARFSEKYKLLSLSPLPSFIDGFDKIREMSEVRLGDYCPMSAFTELSYFGFYWWGPVAIGYAIVVYIVNSRFVYSRTGSLPVVIVNAIITVFCIIGMTYPLRNVVRVPIYAVVILVLFALRSRPYTLKQNASRE